MRPFHIYPVSTLNLTSIYYLLFTFTSAALLPPLVAGAELKGSLGYLRRMNPSKAPIRAKKASKKKIKALDSTKVTKAGKQ